MKNNFNSNKDSSDITYKLSAYIFTVLLVGFFVLSIYKLILLFP